MKAKNKTNRGDAEAQRIQRLAGRIARYLFTDWDGTPNVRRLVVESKSRPFTGSHAGYCEEAVRGIIAKHLLRASASRRLRKVKV